MDEEEEGNGDDSGDDAGDDNASGDGEDHGGNGGGAGKGGGGDGDAGSVGSAESASEPLPLAAMQRQPSRSVFLGEAAGKVPGLGSTFSINVGGAAQSRAWRARLMAALNQHLPPSVTYAQVISLLLPLLTRARSNGGAGMANMAAVEGAIAANPRTSALRTSIFASRVSCKDAIRDRFGSMSMLPAAPDDGSSAVSAKRNPVAVRLSARGSSRSLRKFARKDSGDSGGETIRRGSLLARSSSSPNTAAVGDGDAAGETGAVVALPRIKGASPRVAARGGHRRHQQGFSAAELAALEMGGASSGSVKARSRASLQVLDAAARSSGSAGPSIGSPRAASQSAAASQAALEMGGASSGSVKARHRAALHVLDATARSGGSVGPTLGSPRGASQSPPTSPPGSVGNVKKFEAAATSGASAVSFLSRDLRHQEDPEGSL